MPQNYEKKIKKEHKWSAGEGVEEKQVQIEEIIREVTKQLITRKICPKKKKLCDDYCSKETKNKSLLLLFFVSLLLPKKQKKSRESHRNKEN